MQSKKTSCLMGIMAIALLCPFPLVNAKKPAVDHIFHEEVSTAPSFSQADWISPKDLVKFALTLKGIPYKYGASNPNVGFDCSGFVHYVFRHFAINVPRTSSAFSDSGKKVALAHAAPGDLILFTGTNPNIRKIGHIGIVVSESGEPLRFVHASSGSAHAVTETALNKRYQQRFIKVIRMDELSKKATYQL